MVPRRRRGGPWAPPPRYAQIPGDVDGSTVCFSVVALVLLSGCLFRLFVSGVGILYGHLALQDSTSFWHHVCCPLSFSLPSFCSVCSPATFFSCFLSLFVSLSQALGKPKPFWFGFPLVFSSSWPRSPTSTRTLRSAPTPRLRPAPVFFFFSSSSLVSGSVFSRPCSGGVGFLGGCFSLVFVLVCALHCMTDLGTCKWGRETRHLPPFRPLIIIVVF